MLHFFQGHRLLFSEDSRCHPTRAAPALHILPVSIIASLAPAASIALILFLVKFKFICEQQDNGMSVCLHSGFILGRCSPTFPAGQTDRHSSCLTEREQLSASTEDAGSQVTQGWLTLAVFQPSFIHPQWQDGISSALASAGCQAVLMALGCDAMGRHCGF